MVSGRRRRWNDGPMRSGIALSAVVTAGLLLASCANGTVGSGTAGTGSATPAASASTPTAPSTTPTTDASITPTPTPPPLLPGSGTGAYGYVAAGPTCPVERPDQPCPPRPVSGTITARMTVGTTVATTHSDANGRYALDLSPGTYTLVVDTGSMFPRCPDTPVTVKPGSAIRADISCDTGIR